MEECSGMYEDIHTLLEMNIGVKPKPAGYGESVSIE
jgi:hypothetical protein